MALNHDRPLWEKTIKAKGERAIETALRICGGSSLFVLGGIFALLLWQGAQAFREVPLGEFFLTARWNPTSFETTGYGILSMVASTALVATGAMALVIPLGLGVAAYLSEYANPKARAILKPTIEMMAAIPSVVMGFIGITVIGPAIASVFGLPNGLNALNGSLLLAFMALPTAASLSEDALRGVPQSYREASLALGANRWETLVRVTLPSSRSGIMAAMMLAMGRAVGETMTVLMACGNAPAFPGSWLEAVRPLTATVAIELGEVPRDTSHYHALFAVALVLFVITFAINMIAEKVFSKEEEEAI